MSSYSIIGLMSGTSLDGLDIANCHFRQDTNGNWEFTVNQTQTVAYPEIVLKEIIRAHDLPALDLLNLDKAIGHFFSREINAFLKKHSIARESIDAIASHGHTIFHQPTIGITHQIGCGQIIAYHTGIPVINDFRQKDVIAGGQGAPLVPIGDALLFSNEAEALLNIGGFCNICFPGEPTIAFDICPGNLPLNLASEKLDLQYDKDGGNASEGNLNESFLQKMNALEFYQEEHPKSLGVEWLNEEFYPILKKIHDPKDQLRTSVEHIAEQIAQVLNAREVKSVMITGGGAKNGYLLERLSDKYIGKIIIPEKKIIDFKEAIIFGFLGALYLAKQVNCLSSVTGAEKDVIGGVLHLPD